MGLGWTRWLFPTWLPYGKVDTAMRRPATLVLVGLASAAAIAHALRAPFPASGGNPVLDLIAYHDPALYAVIRVWYYAAPAVAVVLAGSLGLSVWRVWLQARARGGGRGKLPAWPASPNDAAPSLVIGRCSTNRRSRACSVRGTWPTPDHLAYGRSGFEGMLALGGRRVSLVPIRTMGSPTSGRLVRPLSGPRRANIAR